jgi:DNA-binding GntR family transcriptional regulator
MHHSNMVVGPPTEQLRTSQSLARIAPNQSPLTVRFPTNLEIGANQQIGYGPRTPFRAIIVNYRYSRISAVTSISVLFFNTMAAKSPKAERVYRELRADILAGRHEPGARLPYAQMCDRYNTSMGVLRESMLRLTEQGLVRGELQQGFQVTPLSKGDLVELTDARRELESLTLRRALADGDVEWEARLMAANHRLSRAQIIDADDPQRLSDSWVTAHAEFHDALLNGCANERLKNMTAALRDSAELYRRWSLPLGDNANRDVAEEHAAILEAAIARDAERAVALLVGHIEETTTRLLASPIGSDAVENPLAANFGG